MLDKETFKKEYIRMMDSIRPDRCKGGMNCHGVNCVECNLNVICCNDKSNIYQAFETIEIVEKWTKENPVMTIADKFEEVFGVVPDLAELNGAKWCPHCMGFGNYNEYCSGSCSACKAQFWNSEYKEPKKNEDKE